jgi:hydroxymethylpyrimidine/phosphomethylpyrimidine kinase
MLVNAAIVEAVAAAVSALDLPLLVVDPVMVAKSGDRLLDEEGVEALKTELLPRALIVTPNIPEAEILSGRQIGSLEQARAAAVEIHRMGGPAVLIKGGHGQGDTIVDILYGGGDQFTEITTSRIDSKNTHGTGCTLSAAIAAYLALGSPLLDAVVQAQSYVRNAIEHGLELGHGHGPLDHFWQRQAK